MYVFEKFTNHIDYIFWGRHLKSFLCQRASLVPFFTSINQSIDLPFWWWHSLQLKLNLYPRKKTPIEDAIWMLFIPIFTLYRINPYFGETLTMSILSEKKIKCHIFNISPHTCTQQAGLDTFVINVYIVKTRNIYICRNIYFSSDKDKIKCDFLRKHRERKDGKKLFT